LADWWPRGPRRCHNLQFELSWMRAKGCADPAELYDTRLRAWLIDETQRNNLNSQVLQVLGKPAYWLPLDQYPKSEGYSQVPLGILGEYNAQDTIHQEALYRLQEKRLTKDQKKLLDEVIVPLAGVLAAMEARGFHVDPKILTNKIRAAKGRYWPELNIRSSKQMANLLFKDLGLKPTGKTDKGAPQTDIEAVKILSFQEPRLVPLLEAKKAASFVTRMQPWLDTHIGADGIIHPSFNLGNTTTGRLTSSAPNLQNIDRKGDQRFAMTSRHRGGKLVQLDYRQHELAVLAAVANHQEMLSVIRRGGDLHQMQADKLKTERSKAKAINFSIVYGITAHGLLAKNGIPIKEGIRLLAAYFRENPEIRQYQYDQETMLREHGYVESIFGWRRHGLDPDDDRELRQGYNQPIQNAAVVLSYMAMVALERYLAETRMKSRIILQVHDSIVGDCPVREVNRFIKVATQAMMFQLPGQKSYLEYTGDRLPVPIPIAVDTKVGDHL
jgi:DNA polymerase-1